MSLMSEKPMLRYQIFCIYTFLFLALFIALRSEAEEGSIVDYSPLFAVMAMGAFAAFSIVNGVYNLKDCPEAALEVERDVKEAISAMSKKGIIELNSDSE